MIESASSSSADRSARLRILSLNMQVGLHSSAYHQYVTQAWRHVLPSRGVRDALDRIGRLAAQYDVVALQEADAGSLRTAGLNQVAYVCEQAGLAHWHAGVNRNLRPFARHCLGFLARDALRAIDHRPLPGWPPGRGVMTVDIVREGFAPLRLMVTHLALGRAGRARQLAFLAGRIEPGMDTVLMGDLNGDAAEMRAHPALRAAGLVPAHEAPTFPAWRPERCLDHVLVTPGVRLRAAGALPEPLSDHLAVYAEVELRPESEALP